MQTQGVSVAFWDPHFHGRRNQLMELVLPQKAQRVCGGSLEPNTSPHLLTYDDVRRYLDKARDIAPGRSWTASVYLTSEPNMKDIQSLWEDGHITHVKQYPPHGSTNTAESVPPEMLLDENSGPGRLMRMAEECGLPLKRHAEVAHQHGEAVDPYKRERLDLREVEPRIMEMYPKLRRILAHLSTKEGVEHMEQYGNPDSYICEMTAHHAAKHRGILYDGGSILTDHHCLPVIKKKKHWRALRRFIQKRPAYLVAASDAAAHTTRVKHGEFAAFGGLYTYLCDLELYVQVLVELNVLDYAEDFLIGNIRRFFPHIVPKNPPRVSLTSETWTQDTQLHVPGLPESEKVTPFGYHPDPAKRFRFQYKLAA